MDTKICPRCKNDREREAFYKSKRNANGLSDYCIKCTNKINNDWTKNNKESRKISRRRWRQNNPEKEKATSRRFYRNHCEDEKERARIYKKNNPEKGREHAKKWRKNNPEKVRLSINRWCKNNPEKIKEYSKRNKKNHPEQIRKDNRRRRNYKLNAEGSHTEQEWQDKKKKYCYRCAYCGIHENVLKDKYKCKKWWLLTEDHIIPLTKKGTDYINNIIPACVSCNSTKHNKII